MIKIVTIILFAITLQQCGTTGGLLLPEGVKDKSEYQYPKEIDETCYPSEDNKCD